MPLPASKPAKPQRIPLPPAPRSSQEQAAEEVGELRQGELLDSRYKIEGIVGEGGAGRVYRAIHLKLGKPIAIKVLREDEVGSDHQRERFEREAMALAGLSHPNIVSVSDYGVSRGKPYIAMEMLHGRTLRAAIDEGPMSETEALRITRQLLHAVGYAHNEGVVHRDLKPANVFLQWFPTQRDHVKVLDYGFAKFVTKSPLAGAPALTAAGVTFGTPAYIAPERLGGGPVDGRADLYAIGVLLFEMLTGKRPFEGPMPDVLRAHLSQPVPTLAERLPGLIETPPLRDVIVRAMAKTLDQRYSDAGEFLSALDALPVPCVNHDVSAGHDLEALPTRVSAGLTGQARRRGSGRARVSGLIDSLRPLAGLGDRQKLARAWVRSRRAAGELWRNVSDFDRAAAVRGLARSSWALRLKGFVSRFRTGHPQLSEDTTADSPSSAPSPPGAWTSAPTQTSGEDGVPPTVAPTLLATHGDPAPPTQGATLSATGPSAARAIASSMPPPLPQDAVAPWRAQPGEGNAVKPAGGPAAQPASTPQRFQSSPAKASKE